MTLNSTENILKVATEGRSLKQGKERAVSGIDSTNIAVGWEHQHMSTDRDLPIYHEVVYDTIAVGG